MPGLYCKLALIIPDSREGSLRKKSHLGKKDPWPYSFVNWCILQLLGHETLDTYIYVIWLKVNKLCLCTEYWDYERFVYCRNFKSIFESQFFEIRESNPNGLERENAKWLNTKMKPEIGGSGKLRNSYSDICNQMIRFK